MIRHRWSRPCAWLGRANSPETQSGCPLLRRGGGLPHRPGLVWQRRCSRSQWLAVSQLLTNDDTRSAVTRFLPTSLREPRAPLRRARLKPTAPAVTRGARRMHTGILQLRGSETRHFSRAPRRGCRCRCAQAMLRLTTDTEGWRRTPVPSPPSASTGTSPAPATRAPRGKRVSQRGTRAAEGLTYFLLASWSASDSSNLRASSRNFFILSFISLFLANSCLILSNKPERKPFLFPEE